MQTAQKEAVALSKLVSLLSCQTFEEWTAQLLAISRACGFSHMLFGMLRKKTDPIHSAVIRSDYPAQWRATYENLKLHSVDPTVAHSLTSNLPLLWDAGTFSAKPQREFYDNASGYGLRSGITLPIHGLNGEFGMLSFVSNDLGSTRPGEHHADTAFLALLRDYVLESSARFTGGAEPERPGLTARQLECLKWIMEGKSSWETAQILRCSEAAVNFHVANIKTKLGVSSRQQAVVQAIKFGLIAPR